MMYTPTLRPPAVTNRPTLHIALLGPPALTWGDQSFVIARRQARALLYRIAAAAHPVPRDQLGYLLWPDSTEATARRNLTVLLTQIRRALPLPDLLVAADDAIGLNHTAAETDTVALAALLPQATGARRLDLLAGAVRQYRGPFLDGFALPDSSEFDAWASQERQVWERRYLDALAVLIEGYAAAGDYPAAIDAAQQALATDELAEDMHRRLIALYAAAGDRTAAMRQFERCVVVLERELGVDPLPETRAVYEAARDGRGGGTELGRQGDRDTRSEKSIKPALLRVSPSALLPAPLHPLIGRTAELDRVHELLADPGTRLVTLVGPGGSGKTRLAQQIAWEMQAQVADGVVFVPLAPLRDPALVLEVIAQACGLHATGATALGERLRAYLRDKQMLLVLDNCEHVLAAAPMIAGLIATAPAVHVLATSRSALHIQCEHTFVVPPLPLPDLAQLPSLEALAEQPAMALLLARARAHNPRFVLTEADAADLAAICVRLDGLPLAIELAAARLKLLAPRALLKRLDHRLALLTHGPHDLPDRQQTLRATIDWSYRLLDRGERALFEQLAVFAGSWTLEAAEAVASELRIENEQLKSEHSPTLSILKSQFSVFNGLVALLDKSLVQQILNDDGEPRFQILETIREYALEHLEQNGGAGLAAERHAAHFCARAEQAAQYLPTPDAAHWLAQLDDDHANLLAALEWMRSQGHRSAMVRFVQSLGWFWIMRGYLHEGREWVARTLPPPPIDATSDEAILAHAGLPRHDRALLAEAYSTAGHLFFFQGDFLTARTYGHATVTLRRRLGEDGQLALALLTLSAAYWLSGDYAQGMALRDEGQALAERLGDAEALAWLLLERGRDARHRGKPREARGWLDAALAFYRQRGDMWMVAHVLLDLAPVLLALGEDQLAAVYAAEALAISRALKSQVAIAYALNDLGEIARYGGDCAQAATHYAESLQLFRRMGNRSDTPRLLHNLAYVALCQNQPERAAALFHESLAAFHDQRIERGIAESLVGLACVATMREQPLWAARMWGAAEQICIAQGWDLWPPDQIEYARYLARARAASDGAAFSAAWQAGRGLALADAVAEAMAYQVI
jgi:predicted ATPase/DNA-binding SARP family transcriptional activator